MSYDDLMQMYRSGQIDRRALLRGLAGFPGVSEATVYGVHVPGAEGRAGMASLVVEEGVALSARC